MPYNESNTSYECHYIVGSILKCHVNKAIKHGGEKVTRQPRRKK